MIMYIMFKRYNNLKMNEFFCSSQHFYEIRENLTYVDILLL